MKPAFCVEMPDFFENGESFQERLDNPGEYITEQLLLQPKASVA